MKRALAFSLLGIPLVVLIFINFFGLNFIATQIASELKRNAEQNKIFLSAKSVTAYFTGVELKKLELGPKYLPIRIAIDRVTADSSLWELVKLDAPLKVNAELYRGRFSFIGSADISGTPRIQGNAQLRDVDLALHPGLKMLGLRSGVLDIDGNDLICDERGLLQSNFLFSVKNLSKPGETKLPIPTKDGIIPVTIPAITNVVAQVSGESNLSSTIFKEIHLSSSLINLTGNGAITNGTRGSQATIRLDLSLELTEQGQKELGIFFALLTQNSELSTAKSMSLSITGPLNHPQYSVRAIN